jgi:hypothetical protein
MKYSIYFHGVIGFIGFYFLAKQYKLSTLGSLLSSVIFSFGGITGSFLSSGMVVFTNFAYIPFVLLCFNKSLQNIKWGIICGALYALCFYSGYHISLLLGLYILIYTLVLSIVNRTFNPFKTLIVVVITSALIMLPKLILSIQLIRTYPRLYTDVSGYSLYNFFYLLLSQNQNWFGKMNIQGVFNGIDENSIYVGILAFVLFLSFFVKNKKGFLSNISLLVTLLIIFWIMLGNSSSFSLYNGLKQLPVLSSFRVAQRFRFDFIIPFSLITGLGLDNVVRLLQRFKFVKPLSILFLIVIYVDLVIFSSHNFLLETLIIKNPEAQLPRGNAFIQSNISGAGFEIQRTIQLPDEFLTKKSFRPYSFEYLKIKQNIGELECYDTITSFIYPVGIEDQTYQGEYYLLNPANDVKVENTYWSPNKLVYQISNIENTKDNTLIINQNYYPGWIVKTNNNACIRAISVNGLLATKLDSLSDNITFEYNPLLRWLVCRH